MVYTTEEEEKQYEQSRINNHIKNSCKGRIKCYDLSQIKLYTLPFSIFYNEFTFNYYYYYY